MSAFDAHLVIAEIVDIPKENTAVSENLDKSEAAVETLTDEEQRVLSKAIKKVEAEIFYKVLRRLSVWIGIVLTLILVGGIVNLSSCSSNVENSAATKLANDPEVRDKIISRAEENLKDVQAKLKAANERATEIERENARATSTFVGDLQQIRFMVERITQDLSLRFPPSGQGKKNKRGNNQ
jgi:ElaB/YqjD/DUF883 family membrane-anchored ribosome-binding protein